MNIKRAKEEIKNTIEAYLTKDEYGAYAIPQIRQRPVLLMGPPGIGKTQIMEQISRECRICLVAYTITHHTRQSAIGLPYIQEKIYDGVRRSVTEYTMSEIVASIYDKMELTGLREGILFIDEINCVSETLAPTMLQFLQAKTFGNHRIPEGWIIVAAGNPPEYNRSVRDFDVVTLDRIKMLPVEADFPVWKEYAESVGIHPAIISYLDIKRENFCLIETSVDGRQFATPRGWEDLSRLTEIYEKLGKRVDREVVYQYIQHPRIARDFANYLELYYKYESDYKVDEILHGKINESVCDKLARAPFDERLGVMSLLLAGLNDGFRQVVEKEELLARLQELLKNMDPAVYNSQENAAQAANAYENGLDRLEGLAAGLLAERRYKTDAGLLSRAEDHSSRRLQQILENAAQQMKAEDILEPEAVWERVQQIFRLENEHFEEQFDSCGLMLEHAFDFMEAAFGDSQEMVVFVTGLNTGFYSIKFLQEYDCRRYYQYNERLLFDSREQDILKKIDSL